VLEDCTRCGACCFSESPRHARVTGDDYERLGDDAPRFVTFLGNQAFMRIEHDGAASPIGRCAALVLDARSGTFLCSVYDRRPDVCRALERGSPACEGERDAKGGRPRRALDVIYD
jgi:Fe-S-cluster containining protein